MGNIRHYYFIFFLSAVCSIFLFLPQNAEAALITWDGDGADGLWSTPINWVGDAVPGGPAADTQVEGRLHILSSGETSAPFFSIQSSGKIEIDSGGALHTP